MNYFDQLRVSDIGNDKILLPGGENESDNSKRNKRNKRKKRPNYAPLMVILTRVWACSSKKRLNLSA